MLALLAGCGGTSSSQSPSSSPSPSPSPSAADVPPVWVQSEAMWQSLAAGEARPVSAQWLRIDPARAATIGGSATSYLHLFRSMGKAYVVVLRGRFTPDAGQPAAATLLYLVLVGNGDGTHTYLAHGFAASPIRLARLGKVHTYVPRLPVHNAVWGHTMFAGGPFPGGPFSIVNVGVNVWRGHRASGRPLARVSSDANGFFSLDLPPGSYTFKLAASNHGFPMPDTVTVEAGKTVAAGVYGSGP
jgi:hypothetical protein